MAQITITSRDAERLAKSFSDLIGAKGLNAIRRRSVNAIGSKVRKAARVIAPAILSTSQAAVKIQGKAASPGSDNPKYVLRMASKISVEKLKARARRVTRSKGRARLTLTLPSGDKIAFRSVKREGARFVLRAAGPLIERPLGGIFTNPRTAFELYPELATLRKQAAKDLPDAVATAINNHFARRR